MHSVSGLARIRLFFVTLLSFINLVAVGALGAGGMDSRLFDAVKQGDVASVRALIEARADVDARQGDGASALHIAVSRSDEAIVQLLIQAGADVSAVNDLGITPLFVASSRATVAIVDDLLNAGANPNAPDSFGVTPLMMASRLGDRASVAALLGHGANPDSREGTREQTALMWAVVHDHAEVARALIAAGADVHARSEVWSRTALACCQEFNQDPGVPMQVSFGGYTPLMYAAQQGHIESGRRLLAAGAQKEDAAADGSTALVIAAFAGRGPFVRFLLEEGADPNAESAGYSALHVAVLRGDPELAKALLHQGANPSARLKKPTFARFAAGDDAFNRRWVGATPFWLAAAFHDVDLMHVLVGGGSDLALPNDDGATPLLAAIGTKKDGGMVWEPEFRRDIARTGNPYHPTGDEEQTALEATKYVVSLGVDINAVNDGGDTALHRASAKRYVNVAKFLFENGARLDIRNREGQTALGVALAPLQRPFGPSDAEAMAQVIAGIERPREQLVALLRDWGSKE